MLANMWVSTSAANNWQFNPVKWDWGNVKTWSSLVQSGIAGYQIGTEIENWAKRVANRKHFDQLSDIIVDDFNSRFSISSNYSYSDGYLSSLEGIITEDFISLGIGEPFLTKKVYNSPGNWYGSSELVLNVHGTMYDTYNWIQTAKFENDPVKLDTQWGGNNGFYYSKAGIDTWSSQLLQPGADMFFQDRPTANFFSAELTLCGRRGESWYPIRTFSWGYKIFQGKVKDYFKQSLNPSSFHLNLVTMILNNFNINFGLNW